MYLVSTLDERSPIEKTSLMTEMNEALKDLWFKIVLFKLFTRTIDDLLTDD